MAHGRYGKESRWGDRVDVDIPVQLSTTNVWAAAGRMKNLSLSGALVNFEIDLGLHSLIDVRIQTPARPQRAQAIKAYVSRKVKEGIAVEWCEFAPSAVKDLLRSPSITLAGGDFSLQPRASGS